MDINFHALMLIYIALTAAISSNLKFKAQLKVIITADTTIIQIYIPYVKQISFQIWYLGYLH